jgi:pilus assembly protein CpaC
MKIFKLLFSLLAILSFTFANNLQIKELNDTGLSMDKGSFKIIEFEKIITEVKVNDQNIINVEFVEDINKPLQSIKVFASKIGHGNILVTFLDSSKIHLDINVTQNFFQVKNIAKQLAPDLTISQMNGKILLQGKIPNQKIKDSILSLLGVKKTQRKINIQESSQPSEINNERIVSREDNITEIDDTIIDLSIIENPDKMVRLKLFVVEFDNDKGETYTNDWSLLPLGDFFFGDNNLTASITNDSSLSLSGGLSLIANKVGKNFNAAATLKYLQENGVAKVLDETTLITLENKTSKFHSGGTINARTSTADTVQFTEIEYGLKMLINVKQVIDGQYLKLVIKTESSSIDDTYTVDEIPGIKNKTIETNVIIADQATIVLGGLINIGSIKREEKIPLLGDIPLLGKVFTSSASTIDNKELVFFITPEIVDPKNNNQLELLKEKSSFSKEFTLNEKAKKIKEKNNSKIDNSEMTHEQRVKEYLGY